MIAWQIREGGFGEESSPADAQSSCYDLPFGITNRFLRQHKLFQHVPFLPTFSEHTGCCKTRPSCCRRKKKSSDDVAETNTPLRNFDVVNVHWKNSVQMLAIFRNQGRNGSKNATGPKFEKEYHFHFQIHITTYVPPRGPHLLQICLEDTSYFSMLGPLSYLMWYICSNIGRQRHIRFCGLPTSGPAGHSATTCDEPANHQIRLPTEIVPKFARMIKTEMFHWVPLPFWIAFWKGIKKVHEQNIYWRKRNA